MTPDSLSDRPTTPKPGSVKIAGHLFEPKSVVDGVYLAFSGTVRESMAAVLHHIASIVGPDRPAPCVPQDEATVERMIRVGYEAADTWLVTNGHPKVKTRDKWTPEEEGKHRAFMTAILSSLSTPPTAEQVEARAKEMEEFYNGHDKSHIMQWFIGQFARISFGLPPSPAKAEEKPWRPEPGTWQARVLVYKWSNMGALGVDQYCLRWKPNQSGPDGDLYYQVDLKTWTKGKRACNLAVVGATEDAAYAALRTAPPPPGVKKKATPHAPKAWEIIDKAKDELCNIAEYDAAADVRAVAVKYGKPDPKPTPPAEPVLAPWAVEAGVCITGIRPGKFSVHTGTHILSAYFLKWCAKEDLYDSLGNISDSHRFSSRSDAIYHTKGVGDQPWMKGYAVRQSKRAEAAGAKPEKMEPVVFQFARKFCDKCGVRTWHSGSKCMNCEDSPIAALEGQIKAVRAEIASVWSSVDEWTTKLDASFEAERKWEEKRDSVSAAESDAASVFREKAFATHAQEVEALKDIAEILMVGKRSCRPSRPAAAGRAKKKGGRRK